MKVVHSVSDLRASLSSVGDVTFVPTMGNLHAGHLALVRQARQRERPVVVSIFVNPLQFAPSEDFDEYPRTLSRDCELLEAHGCDFVFAPSVAAMYPTPQTFVVHPDPMLASVLEGKTRPAFFAGVCTVVMKLFNIVRPRVAVFGKKDYQQWLVVQRLVREFNLDIAIEAGETIREEDGLAMSSRNGFLNDIERAEAPFLHQLLMTVAEDVRHGTKSLRAIETAAIEALRGRGAWDPDYVSIRSRETLAEPTAGDELVVVAAARLGKIRLIDNVEI